MKNLTRITLLLVLFTVSQSCSDILDNAQPSVSISQEVALSDPGAVESIRANMYSRLQTSAYTTTYMLGASSLADGLTTRAGATRLTGHAQNNRGAGMGSWGTAYNLINDANILINGVEDGVLAEETEMQYRGEALMLRAFAVHHLVRAYGYEPGMMPGTGQGAGFDLGVIIRTKATLSADDATFRPRKTVSMVYDQIESDLMRSIDLLSQGDAGNPEFVTQAAAEALMGRVALYRQNYQAAEDFASDALANTSATLAQPSQVSTMFDETSGLNPEAIFLINFNPPSEQIDGSGINSGLNAFTATQWMAQVPTQDLIDLYNTSDARLSWFAPCFNDAESSTVSGCPAMHPSIAGGTEGLELQKWNGDLGSFTDNVPLFRVAEMKLIQSEARLNGATGDPDAPINELRQARGLTTLTNVTMDDILDERRREFVGEGQRFFDLKRLGMDIRKAPETGLADVPYIDYRILDNIPNGEVTLSEEEAPADSVLIQNPGY